MRNKRSGRKRQNLAAVQEKGSARRLLDSWHLGMPWRVVWQFPRCQAHPVNVADSILFSARVSEEMEVVQSRERRGSLSSLTEIPRGKRMTDKNDVNRKGVLTARIRTSEGLINFPETNTLMLFKVPSLCTQLSQRSRTAFLIRAWSVEYKSSGQYWVGGSPCLNLKRVCIQNLQVDVLISAVSWDK